MALTIKETRPLVWNFTVIGGSEAWKEVAYSARMSGVPAHIQAEEVFKMILRNDYMSAMEHIIIKFDIKLAKGIAPEMLEHRLSSHSGFSTRYVHPNASTIELAGKEKDVYEIITPWHLIKTPNLSETKIQQRKIFFDNVQQNLETYEKLLSQGLPRESARYILPFSQAVGIYHFTINLRSLINFLSLRLCVRVAPEMRSVASQMYFALQTELPILQGMLGCRGFMKRACPESDVTGVRIGKQHPVYPPCLFKNPQSDIFIPTQKELATQINLSAFQYEKAVKTQEHIFKQWAEWQGE